MWSPGTECTPITFASYITREVENLHMVDESTARSVEEEEEAVLLCLQALTHYVDGAKLFCREGVVQVAIGYLHRSSTAPPDSHRLLVWRSVVATFQHFVEHACRDFVEATTTADLGVMMQFASRLSRLSLDDINSFALKKALYGLMLFLTMFLDNTEPLERVRLIFVEEPTKMGDTIKLCLEWISAPNEATTTSTLHGKILEDLQFAMLGFLTILVRSHPIARVLASRAEFVEVVQHLVTVIENLVTAGEKSVNLILQFLCLVTEAASTTVEASSVRESLSTPALIRVVGSSCVSPRALAHAVRILWLLQRSGTGGDSEESSRHWVDVHQFVSSVLQRAKIASMHPELLMGTLGLLAELLVRSHKNQHHRQYQTPNDRAGLIRLLRHVLLFRGVDGTLVIKHAVFLATQAGADPYSSALWDASPSCREVHELGVLHQLLRCFGSCSDDELHNLLGQEHPTRIEAIFRHMVFAPAMCLLAVRDTSSPFVSTMVCNVASMMENVFKAFYPMQLRRYQSIARQENFLLHCCMQLELSGAEVKLQVRYLCIPLHQCQPKQVRIVLIDSAFVVPQVLRAMRVYCDKHMTVWDEIESLRAGEHTDLLGFLVSYTTNLRHDGAELSGKFALEALRVFSALIEHSCALVVHASAIGCLERLMDAVGVDSATVHPDYQRDFETECGRACLFILRVPGESAGYDYKMGRKLWRLLVRWISGTHNSADTHTAQVALQSLVECTPIHSVFIQLCNLEWSHGGAKLIHKLAEFACSENRHDEATIVKGKYAVQALQVFVSSDHIVNRVLDDPQLISSIFAKISSFNPLFDDRIKLLTGMISSKMGTNTVDSGLSFRHVLKRYACLHEIPIAERAAYLDLVPVLLPLSRNELPVEPKTWKGILENTIYFLEHGSLRESAAAQAALTVFMRSEERRRALTDILPLVKRIWMRLQRSFEHGLTRLSKSPCFVTFVNSPQDAPSRRESVDLSNPQNHSRRRSSIDGRYVDLATSGWELRRTVSVILQLGRFLSSHTSETCYMQRCVSLIMSQVFYADSDAVECEITALSEVVDSIVSIGSGFSHVDAVWASREHFSSFSRWLIRSAMAPRQVSRQQLLSLHLVTRLLKTDTQGHTDTRTNAFSIPRVLAIANADVIDIVWWSAHTTPTNFAAEHKCLALWCDLLRLSCNDVAFSKRLMTSRIVHELVVEVLNACYRAEMLCDDENVALLALIRQMLGLHQDDMQFLSDNTRLLKVVIDHCIRTAALCPVDHPVQLTAVELLFRFMRHDKLSKRALRTCRLRHALNSKDDRRTRRTLLRGLSNVILQCSSEGAALLQTLSVVHQLANSELGIVPLVHARQGIQHSMVHVLAFALRSTIGTPRKLLLRTDRTQPMTHELTFLPEISNRSPLLHACSTALALLRLCMDNVQFADAIQHEIGIFSELFAALGCSDWEITTSAATIVARCLRWPYFDPVDDSDEQALSDNGISKYMCSTEPSDENQYRRLTFFATLNEQRVFDIEPDTTDLPSSFLLLAVWIRFYSRNLSLLRVTPSAARDGKHSRDVTPRNITATTAMSRYELHLLNILDILLYLFANYSGVVYDVADGTPIPDEKVHHSELCLNLLEMCKRELSDDQYVAVVTTDMIRSKALVLLQVLNSFELSEYSSDVIFTREPNIARLLTVIETATSTQEQQAAVHLLFHVTSNPRVKEMFVTHQSLLLQVCSWLENPRLEVLQQFAIGTLKNLATKSFTQRRQSMFAFAPSFHEQLTRLLFQGKQYGRKASVDRYIVPKRTVALRAVLTVCLRHQKEVRRLSANDRTVVFPVRVKAYIKVVCSNTTMYQERAFQLSSLLRSTSDRVVHEIPLDKADGVVECAIVVGWRHASGSAYQKARTLVTHAFDVNEVSELRASPRRPTSSTMYVADNLADISLSSSTVEQSADDIGAIGRVLRHEDINPAILADGASIVAELCKNKSIFCDDKIRLREHVLAVMSAHAKMPPQENESDLAIACLQNLSSWFRSNPSVDFFLTSMKPLLQLIQGMRHHELTASDSSLPAVEARRDDVDAHTRSSDQNFLTGLIEWVAAIEIPGFTENCLNTLFLENSDTLLFLCSKIFPARSPRASFFFLVATAVRTNMVHCETFARKHSLRLLVNILDTSSSRDNDDSYAQMLRFAARVVTKICRHSTARDKFVRHGGLRFFGRVAYEVFRFEWCQRRFPRVAAENLVLAASFLSDFVTDHVFVDPNDPRDMKRMGFLVTRASGLGYDATAISTLSVVETLLHFIGCAPERLATTQGATRLFDSFDRLAARVLTSILEKHPQRTSVEHSFLLLASHSSLGTGKENSDPDRRGMKRTFMAGLERCIALTKWDFDSDLNLIRRAYYAGICGGVRTGVIPPQCRNVFIRFDQDFLVSEIQQHPGSAILLASLDDLHSRSATSRSAHTHRYAANDTEEVDSHSARKSIERELKQLLAFVAEHEELVNTLAVNRKKHLVNSIKVADRNVRVMVACHSVLSLALDFYVDMVATIQGEMSESKFEFTHVLHLGNARRITVVQEWLVLLEELSGLVCCALHELDANYYGSLLHQLYTLVTELPAFLRKMERVQSRMHTCLLFFKNLNSVFKRIANKNELKGVAGNGFGVAEEAAKLYERLEQLEPEVSDALAYVLASKETYVRLARLLVAMDYMWKRVFGTSSVSVVNYMAGATRTNETIWAKLRRRVTTLLVVVADPVPLLVGHWKKVKVLLATVGKILVVKEQLSGQFHAVNDPLESPAEDPGAANKENSPSDADREVSYFPFCSLESLLDHFGYVSLRVKKIKQLITIPTLRQRVLRLLARVFSSQASEIEKLSVLQFETLFHQLPSDGADSVFQQLRALSEEADGSVRLRLVKKVSLDISLWRFVVRPVQRARLFHLYFLMNDFMSSDADTQHTMQREYQAMDEHRHDASSRDSFLVPVDDHGLGGGAGTTRGELSSFSPPMVVVKRSFKRERKKTLLEFFNPSELKLRIGVISDDASLGQFHHRAQRSSLALFDTGALSVCDTVSLVDPLSEAMAVKKLREALLEKKKQARRSAWSRFWFRVQTPYRKYVSSDSRAGRFIVQTKRRLQLLALFVAFWRQEELAADLKNDMLAKAFDSPVERDSYFLSYHIRKATTELMRVWMPESGNLGLRLWQMEGYLIVGTFASVAVPYLLSSAYGTDEWDRHWFMERVIYLYVGFIFFLSALSIFVIARSTFGLFALYIHHLSLNSKSC